MRDRTDFFRVMLGWMIAGAVICIIGLMLSVLAGCKPREGQKQYVGVPATKECVRDHEQIKRITCVAEGHVYLCIDPDPYADGNVIQCAPLTPVPAEKP